LTRESQWMGPPCSAAESATSRSGGDYHAAAARRTWVPVPWPTARSDGPPRSPTTVVGPDLVWRFDFFLCAHAGRDGGVLTRRATRSPACHPHGAQNQISDVRTYCGCAGCRSPSDHPQHPAVAAATRPSHHPGAYEGVLLRNTAGLTHPPCCSGHKPCGPVRPTQRNGVAVTTPKRGLLPIRWAAEAIESKSCVVRP